MGVGSVGVGVWGAVVQYVGREWCGRAVVWGVVL